MSLLLEALKKAEKAKRANTGVAPNRDLSRAEPGAGNGLAIEMLSQTSASPQSNLIEMEGLSDALSTLSEAEPPAKIHEQAFPEISLADMEEPESAPQETIAAAPELSPATNLTSADFAPMECAAAAFDAHQPVQAAEPQPVSLHIHIPEEKTEPALSLDFPGPKPTAITKTDEPSITATIAPEAAREPAPPQPDIAPAFAKATPAPESLAPPAPSPTLPDATDTVKKQETAKMILAATRGNPKRNLKRLASILVLSMAIGAVAAYYYWQAISQPTLAFHPPQQPPATAQTPELQQPASQPVEANKDASQPAPAPPHETKEPNDGAQAEESLPRPEPAAAEKPARSKKSAETPAGVTKREDSPNNTSAPGRKSSSAPNDPDKISIKSPENAGTTDSAIKFRRDASDTRLDPLLAGAYQAFMAGDISKAENDYRKALHQTPNNRDALLGLAAIAANRGQAQEAASIYLRVLQLDPKDSAAQTGLIGLKGYSDPTLSESRLKTLLAQQPDVGYLHFALGNLYAYQARWPEAQEAYFNALHCDGGNADYAFNLAVSLDHLDQRKPALTYYQRALTLVKDRSASFDSEQLKKRIHELQAN